MTAQVRQWVYLGTGLLAAIVPIAVQAGLLDTGQGDSSATLIASIAALIGGGGALTAAHHTRKQVAEGLHDPALPPIDQITEAAGKVMAEAEQANANIDKLKQLSTDLLGAGVNVGVDLTNLVVPQAAPVVNTVGSLAEQVLDQLIVS